MLVTNFKLKYVLYKLVCGFYQLFDVGRVHPMRERSLRALQRTVDYIERALPDALGFDSQRELIEYSLAEAKIDGHYLEFGVYTGGTIRFIASRIGSRLIHGFDTFEGLPEAWGGFNLGRRAFDAKGKLPRVPDNVRLHRGLFEASLPAWLKDNTGSAAFVHIDCDLYSSTQTALTLLADNSCRARSFCSMNILIFRTGNSTNTKRSGNSSPNGASRTLISLLRGNRLRCGST